MQNHIPVLLKEVIDILKPTEGIIIDATLGFGGHTKAILERSKTLVIGLDQDNEVLEEARKNLKNFQNRVIFLQDNFRNLKEISQNLRISGKVSGIIMDLGVSSLQLDKPERGFSFQNKGPLDMRMDKREKLTAYEIINSWPKEEIYSVIRNFGEERLASRISKAIVEQRRKEKIKTTTELAELIKRAVSRKYSFSKIHPATLTFQALRIAVNQELLNLQEALNGSLEVLSPGGKIIVISFHSLEDRIVKRFFKDMAKKSKIEILTKKPVIPKEEEIRENPRSRSAKLRAAEKI